MVGDLDVYLGRSILGVAETFAFGLGVVVPRRAPGLPPLSKPGQPRFDVFHVFGFWVDFFFFFKERFSLFQKLPKIIVLYCR